MNMVQTDARFSEIAHLSGGVSSGGVNSKDCLDWGA